MLTIITFAIVLSVLIFVHEFGHFIVAKRTGIVVEEFAFGFPPRLLKYWQEEGKVLLDGKEMIIGRKTNVSREIETSTRVIYESETQPDGRAIITRIQPIADKMSDDEIVQKFGRPASTVEQLERGTEYTINTIPFGGYVRMLGEEDPTAPGSFASKSKKVRIGVLVAGAAMNVLLAVVVFTATAMLGVPELVPSDEVMVLGIAPGSPAEKANLQIGDIVLSIDDIPVKSPEELIALTGERLDQEITLTIRHKRDTMQVVLTPRSNPPKGEGAIGIHIEAARTELKYYPLDQALLLGAQKTVGILALVPAVPILLLRGLIPAELVRPVGPVGIYQQTASAVQASVQMGWWYPILTLVGWISTALAITNVLPLPALDGGRIFFIIVEAIRGRRVDPAREGFIHFIGLVILMALMLVISYFDITDPMMTIDWANLF